MLALLLALGMRSVRMIAGHFRLLLRLRGMFFALGMFIFAVSIGGGAMRTRVPIASDHEHQFLETITVPADGNTAAAIGNGNFGTSPFFGQL
jgi:hypothetical protein